MQKSFWAQKRDEVIQQDQIFSLQIERYEYNKIHAESKNATHSKKGCFLIMMLRVSS
jgi:hypothetical protein